jgi:NAD(P)-dependent dehydrogenase (short-subunit alcohol dehydrogenase family)
MIDTPMMQEWFRTNPELAQAVLASKPQHRLAHPEQVAEAAVWLCSDAADWVSGLSMVIDGGGLNR